MKHSVLEVVLGFLVLLAFSLCLYWALANKGEVKGHTYNIDANFADATGLSLGSEVKISGVGIGKVVKFSLDPKQYSAIVTMAISNTIKIPTDSSAKVISAGFLGEKFVAISPGVDEEYLQENGTITFTQSTLGLEELLSKFLFGMSNDNKKK